MMKNDFSNQLKREVRRGFQACFESKEEQFDFNYSVTRLEIGLDKLSEYSKLLSFCINNAIERVEKNIEKYSNQYKIEQNNAPENIEKLLIKMNKLLTKLIEISEKINDVFDNNIDNLRNVNESLYIIRDTIYKLM